MSVAVCLRGAFRYGDQYLFRGLALHLAAGCWTGLLGSSGVGKSTVLKLLAGLPTGGRFEGQITTGDGEPIVPRIAYMAQADRLFPWLDVRANVALGTRLRGEPPDRRRADQLIRQVGLQAHGHKRPHELSGGMRQRVALARTLLECTPVVLLDEPFSALDAGTRREMQDLAFTMLRGKTVLLVSHDSAEALRLSHHLLLMSSRGVVQHPLATDPPPRALTGARFARSQTRLLLALHRAAEATDE